MPAGWDPSLYDARHSFVWALGADLIEVLAPRPGERILDLGSGTGHLTQKLFEAGAVVSGLDRDPAMVEAARRSYPHLAFELGDAADFRLAAPVDAVFSNATLHWVLDARGAAASIAAALRPGGRFVAELGGHGNVRAIHHALEAALRAEGVAAPPRPWYYPRLGEYAVLLESAGLEVTFATLRDRPTPLDGGDDGLRSWIRMFGTAFLAAVPEHRHAAVFDAVEAATRPALHRDGRWWADYRRLRVVARRAAE